MTLLISHIRAQKSGGWECSLRNYDQGGRVKTESSTKKLGVLEFQEQEN